ncbi:ABC transporter ATP-binding protein [Amycolatopsis sp. KNN50.9b]|uniref:ABC transporter ATP-binding protein n=1 Tax=Amycolatopsis sp. KNN50.9b TaxID=2018303 RepID=UPI000B8AC9EE|nr:ABC transporter ATP-binding protein [Amycolatopsis sp. KNN50.9b]OXM70682.1 ABC transporter [Amycolatopsis sp. KNN50.9b]
MSTTFGAIVRRGGAWLPVIGFAALAGTLSTLALPAVLGRAVDAIVAGDDSGRWLVLAAALVVVGILADLIDASAGIACVASTTAWLRNRLVRQVLRMGPDRARRFDTGDLVSRISGNAVDAAQAGPAVVTVVAAVLPPAGSLVLLVVIDPWLAVAFVAGLAVVAAVLRAFTIRSTAVFTAYQRTQGRIAARLAESLAGARTIAAAGTAGREESRVLEPLPELHGHGRQTWQVLSRAAAQGAVAGPLVLVAVLAVGGLALVDGRITAGDLFAASRYAVLGAGLGGLAGVFGQLARARAGAARAAEVLTVPAVGHGSRGLPEGTGRLEFRHVTVRSDGTTLLDDVDLTVPGGATVAVVGRSGAGKSVLAALAARLRDPDEGEVRLDGVPLGELSHAALRTAVCAAFERPVLVGATVGDAIGPGRDRAELLTAARATHAHEFVSRYPEGYDTPLADAPMSGGEAQRLGLARAWHARRLLVLDDATSSLDMVTEMQISRTLTGDGGRTRLIVTHRVSTAARADCVVWLDGGRVRAVAPHHRLWQDAGYREAFG